MVAESRKTRLVVTDFLKILVWGGGFLTSEKRI